MCPRGAWRARVSLQPNAHSRNQASRPSLPGSFAAYIEESSMPGIAPGISHLQFRSECWLLLLRLPPRRPRRTPAQLPTPGAPPAFGTAPAVGPEVSAATFAEAEKLVQVQMTAPEREQAAEQLARCRWRPTTSSRGSAQSRAGSNSCSRHPVEPIAAGNFAPQAGGHGGRNLCPQRARLPRLCRRATKRLPCPCHPAFALD